MCVVDSSEQRLLVANHLEDNRVMYCDFLSEPVASHDSYNADTEAPSEEDALIATVADPQLQTKLRWERYIQRLRSGAWGDNIAVQGIPDMFSITVNVLSSQIPTIIPITPSSGTSQHDVYVGLIMQYHYVGLDQVNMEVDDSSTEDSTPSSTDNPLDDAMIKKGDEHTMCSSGKHDVT